MRSTTLLPETMAHYESDPCGDRGDTKRQGKQSLSFEELPKSFLNFCPRTPNEKSLHLRTSEIPCVSGTSIEKAYWLFLNLHYC